MVKGFWPSMSGRVYIHMTFASHGTVGGGRKYCPAPLRCEDGADGGGPPTQYSLQCSLFWGGDGQCLLHLLPP